MRKLRVLAAILLAVLFLSSCGAEPQTEQSESVRARLAENGASPLIATYNTAAPWGNLLKGTASGKRAPLFAKQMADIAPDSFGVQEINSDWVEKMETLLPDYAYYGVPRGGDKNEKTSEMSGIFYLREKYDLCESGTFWISDTPDTESKYPDAGCNRVCSYVVLKNRETGFTYAHFNTHLDNVSEAARTLGGRLITERAALTAQKYGGSLPTVITGDFNQDASGTVCEVLREAGFVNAADSAGDEAHFASYHDWDRFTEGEPIDFIFGSSGSRATAYTIHREKIDDTFVSDHYCVSAQIDF